MRRLITAAAIALAAIAVVAPAAQGASTRAEYIAQADPVCAKWNAASLKQLKGFAADIENERWGSAARRFRIALGSYKSLIASVSAIEQPAADAALLGRWLDGLRSQTPQAKSVLAAVKKHSVRKVAARSQKLAANSRRTQALVADYGFKACDES